ncbi:hypothetical protein [Porticoccus sp.]
MALNDLFGGDKRTNRTGNVSGSGTGVLPTNMDELAELWFPGDQTTQRFAKLVFETLATTGLDQTFAVNKQNVSALIQTFARGEAFENADKFKSDLMFHFTYERDPALARQAGLVNPNAETEINAVSGNTAIFQSVGTSDRAYASLAPIFRAPESAPESPVFIGNDEVLEAPTSGPLGIIGGGRTVRVIRADMPDLFIQVFDLPGGEQIFYQFQDLAQLKATFGDNPQFSDMSFDAFNGMLNDSLFAAGEASEIIGLGGQFAQLYQAVRTQALRAAGIFDPGLQGAILNDPEISNIIVRASFAGQDTTGPGIMGEIRATNYWRNVLYPGIDQFYSQNIANPEQAWRNYSNAIEPGLRRLGISPDADGSFKSNVGRYLRAGVSNDEFNKFLPIAVRIQNNPDLKRNLDAWAQIELGRNLNFNEFLDVLTRTNDPELDRVIESATLAFAAERAGVNISVSDIRRIAEQTDLTEAAALQAFTQQERAILAIGDQDLQGFGFSRQDILDVAVGATPRSGLGAAEVQNLVSKLATERGISDDPNARFFLGFNRRGQAERTGLQALAQQGG